MIQLGNWNMMIEKIKNIDDLVQDFNNYIVNALELLQAKQNWISMT